MIQYIADFVLLLALCFRFISWRRNHRDPVFYAILFGLAAALFNTQPILQAIGRAFGADWVAGVLASSVIAHLLMQTALFFIRSAILQAVAPERLTRASNLIPYLVATAVQVITFAFVVASPTWKHLTAGSLAERDEPAFLTYMVTFYVYLLWVLLHLSWVSLRNIRSMTGALRTGFTLIGIGCFTTGIGAAGAISGLLVNALVSAGAGSALLLTWSVGQGLGIIFIGTGLSIPPASSALARRRERRELETAVTELEPLWHRAVVEAGRPHLPLPDVATPVQRAHRMVIELKDVHMATGGNALSDPELALVNAVAGRVTRRRRG